MGLSTQRLRSDSFEHAGAHDSPAGMAHRRRKFTVVLGTAMLCCLSFFVGAIWGATCGAMMSLLTGDWVVDNTRTSSALLSSPRSSGRRHIFTVFSTSCSPYQDWQAQALIYSHKNHNIEGELVRLMSCGNSNYTLPKHSHDHYRVIRTPDFNSRVWCDNYSPRNRPQSMSYWLNGLSEDTDLPHDDDVVIQVDPDHIFLSSHNDVSSVMNGTGMAAAYELGQSWIQDWAITFCDGKCDTLESGYDGSYGMPYVLTAGDARRHADLWSDVTEEMREKHDSKGWLTEMFSGIIAARRLGIQMNVIRMMLSVSEADLHSEPWDKVRGWHDDSPPSVGVWVAHYCQKYGIGKFKWYKSDNQHTDIRLCNRSSAMNFPSPDEADVMEMQRARDGPLDFKNGTREAVVQARNVWMLDHTLEPVRQAIDAYYDEFC